MQKFKHMKNKIMNRLAIALMCFTLIGVFAVSCNKDDDNAGSVELYSFGPTPVLRGNEIRFIGQNLDQVNSVIIPPSIDISDINVISSSEIRVTVPQEAEVGHVVLNYKGGSITTKTLIGYSEPYEITSISPTDNAIREGDEVTINGDYLNNIVKVIFSGNAAIDSADFVVQARKQIKVVVPKEASSGKIIVEDAAGNQLYSDQELSILQPTVSSFSSTDIKAGQDLTINGQNLDLVSMIEFQGGSSISATDFVSQEAGYIVVGTPVDLHDGTVKLVAYSGVEVVSSQSLTTVIPTDIQIAAESQFKTGLNVVISGSNLDLVTAVTFSGGSEITDFTTADGSITLPIPGDAVDGTVTLSTASGKSVTTDALTLVKPTITAIAPSPVTAGNDIIITGTDLDLVKSVIFKDGLNVDITTTNETSLTVTVPSAAVSGTIMFVAINGEQVESTDELTVESANVPVITSITQQIKPGGMMVIEGSKLNLVESVVFQDDIKATSFGSRTESMIEVYVPETAKAGTVTLRLVTFDLTEVISPEFSITGVDPILSTTVIVMDFEQHGDHNGSWDNSWDGNSEILSEGGNTFLRITGAANGWILNCNHQANGAPAPVINNIDDYVLKFDIRIEDGVTGAENAELQVVLGDGWHWYGAGLLPASTGGEWTTVSIPVSALGLSGTVDMSSGTNGIYGGVIPAGVSLDNLRFDLK